MTTVAMHFRNFLRDDERGAITVLMLVLFIGIILMTGVALDLAKYESERVDLQAALDRGLLAAAHEDQTMPARDVIEEYLATRSYTQTAVTYDAAEDVKINGKVVRAYAQREMPTTFLRLAGLQDLPMGVQGTAQQLRSNIEISLILDISGSMRFPSSKGHARMLDLIPAAQKFIRTITENGDSDTVTITLVRYAGQTNPGEWMFRRLGGQSCTPERSATKSAIFADANYDPVCNVLKVDTPTTLRVKAVGLGLAEDFFVTPDPDSDNDIDEGLFRYENYDPDVHTTILPPDPLWSHDFSHCFYMDTSNDWPNKPTSPGVFPSGTNAALPAVQTRNQIAHFMKWEIASDWMGWGWCPGDEMQTIYHSNDMDTLVNAIGNIVPDYRAPDDDPSTVDDDPATFSPTGGNMHDGTGTYNAMLWGVAMLDPVNQPIVKEMADAGFPEGHLNYVDPDYDDRPAAVDDSDTPDPDTQTTEKVVVLMTDGKITDQFDVKDVDEVSTNESLMAQFAAGTGVASTNKLFNRTTGRDDFFYPTCEYAKHELKATVFTIAFETPHEDEMKKCASKNAFYSADALNIESTFDAIASAIGNLKLVATE